MKNLLFIVFSLSLLLACKQNPTPMYQEKGVITDQAMVVSAHPAATDIGKQILQAGGNAVDAMVAVHMALAVTIPRAGNIGGGGFMVMREQTGTVHCLDYREMAPSAAERDMYLDTEGNPLDSLSKFGHLAAGVPGSVAGMVAAHDSLGKLPWAQVIEPAISLAREGYTLTEVETQVLNKKADAMRRFSTQSHPFMAKKVWQIGDTIKQEALAQTLERIRDRKNEGFYAGKTAELILAEMQRGGGLISQLDLTNYQAVWREAVRGDYKGYGIIGMPPPSSGGIALIQLLEMVEPYPLATDGWQAAATVHVMAEAERRVYADRSVHVGDMDYVEVPLDRLLDTAYIDERMTSFSPNKITPSTEIAAGNITGIVSEETTHFSIVDQEGNAVSVTTTLNGGYGSCVVVGGAGFVLNNEMDDFSVKPGHPNLYGLVGAEANAIQAGKRMLSSMTPTIVEKDDELFMVVGTPGGATIITSVFQTILNVIEHDMSMQGAVTAPRFHHQWLPDKISFEAGALQKANASLIAKGHILEEREPIGRVNAILVLPDGKLEGGADPRRDATAAGF